MSVLYGADALGAVVNMITRKPDKKLTGKVRLTSRIANGDFNDDSNNDVDGHDADLNISGGVTDNLQLNVGVQHARRASVASKLKPGKSAIEGRKK